MWFNMGPRTLLLTLSVLVWPGSVRLCNWDQTVAPDQGLDPVSFQSGAFYLKAEDSPSDPDQCRKACCSQSNCDLALVGYPQDGNAHCFLVSCFNEGRDVCALQSSSQFKVFKKVNPEDRNKVQMEPRSNEPNHVLCRRPMKVGSCRAAFPKFFYNVTEQICRSFTYGGCESNGNNFETKDKCESFCSGVTGPVLLEDSTPAPESGKAPRMAPPFHSEDQKAESAPDESNPAVTEPVPAPTKEISADEYAERCKAELQVGPCRAAFQRWYFNSLSGRCERFVYGGCKGNKNNYENEESCRSMCAGVTVLPSSKKKTEQKDETSSYEENCMVTSDPGPCRAAFPAFYYDHKTSTCRSFTYGGCRGNKNRYNTEEECMNRCSQGVINSHAVNRSRWTAAFFLFFTMAAISVLLLAALIIVTLKRRRLSHRPSSMKDKEELLPDADGSSLESLSLPETPTMDRA